MGSCCTQVLEALLFAITWHQHMQDSILLGVGRATGIAHWVKYLYVLNYCVCVAAHLSEAVCNGAPDAHVRGVCELAARHGQTIAALGPLMTSSPPWGC